MNRRFLKHFRIVAICHVGLVVIMLTTSAWTGLFESKTEDSPAMEFIIAVEGPPVPRGKLNVIEPAKDTVPDQNESKVEAINSNTGKKQKIEKGRKITRPVNAVRGGGGAVKSNLTPAEIDKFMKMGAKMGDHTFIPDDEDVRCKAIIKNAMDEAWNQPSKDDTGDVFAEATIGLSRNGRVTWRKLTKKSGNNLFDETVMQAVNSVEVIENLTPAFLDKYREAKVTFKYE